ncbi:hypothetical protein GCM10009556_056010 [Acrocarpospora pleiomorpha]
MEMFSGSVASGSRATDAWAAPIPDWAAISVTATATWARDTRRRESRVPALRTQLTRKTI